jgi:hypothetical protein
MEEHNVRFIQNSRGDYINLATVERIEAAQRGETLQTIVLSGGATETVYPFEARSALNAGGQVVPSPPSYKLVEVVGGGDDDPDDLYFTPIIAFYITPTLEVWPIVPEGVREEQTGWAILQADGRVCTPGGNSVYETLDSYRQSLREER